MSAITASPEIDISQLDGAPDEPWLRAFNEQYNELGRQVVSNINQNTPFGNCRTTLIKPYDLLHATSVTIANPLDVPIVGIYPVACVGLSVDSTGKPTRGVYNLAMPDIEWHKAANSDGVVVTARFGDDGSGENIAGQTHRIFRTFTNRTALTSGSPTAIASTTSLSIGAGTWRLTGGVGFSPAATTSITQLHASINTSGTALSGADTLVLPDSTGRVRVQDSRAANVPGANVITLNLPTYTVVVAEGVTRTLFLVGQGIFTVSTLDAFGFMEAVRETPYLTGIRGKVGLLFIGGG